MFFLTYIKGARVNKGVVAVNQWLMHQLQGGINKHQCFDKLLDPPWTSWASWGQLVQHPKVSKLPCPQTMSKSSTISLQSDDQQAGQVQKVIQVQVLVIQYINHMLY